MNTAWPTTAALVASWAACGCATSDPGEGAVVATIGQSGDAIAVSVDQSDVYVIMLDAAGAPRVAVERVRGSQVTDMPLGATDWSDYTASGMIALDPSKTAVVSGGRAYFLGAYGVTVVPLDGSPGHTLFPPLPGSAAGHAHLNFGSFGVDGSEVYVCADDIFTTNSSNLARFNTDGTWEILFTGSLPVQDESCFAGAVAADEGAVYWSTSQAIRAFHKGDGTVSTVVDLGGLAFAPPLLAIHDASLAWFDILDTAFHVADKTATTPARSAALGDTARLQLTPTDPEPLSVLLADEHLYWLTLFDLHRLPSAGGRADVLARRPASGGRFMGLALSGDALYFTNGDTRGDGGSGILTLHSVPW